MEELINQAFLDMDVIGPHVRAGRYDLVSPHGEVIHRQLWEAMIEPGWSVTMHMWPMPEPPPPLSEPSREAFQPTLPPTPDAKMLKSSHVPMHSQQSQGRRQPSADASSDHQTPLEGLQTPLSPSLTGTSATNTESVQSNQLGSQMSRTSISDENVVKE